MDCVFNKVFDKNELDLSKAIDVRDKDGRTAVAIGLVCTVFIERPWERATKEAVTEVATRYVEQFREHLRYAKHPESAEMYPITSSRIKPLGEWLPSHPEDEGWSFSFHGGETETAASGFEVRGHGSDNIMKGLGYVHASFPLLWFAESSGSLQEFVLEWCKRLKPLSGYAGLGIIESPDIYERIKFQAAVRMIGERFPGLEVQSFVAHTIALTDGIKGVNWLTILGERWVDAMGGLDYVRMRLDEPSFPFYRYDGGLIIQAGPKPEFGDAQANRWPRYYVTLAKVLKRIQIKSHQAFHFGGDDRRMDKEASEAWLFRFDGK